MFQCLLLRHVGETTTCSIMFSDIEVLGKIKMCQVAETLKRVDVRNTHGQKMHNFSLVKFEHDALSPRLKKDGGP